MSLSTAQLQPLTHQSALSLRPETQDLNGVEGDLHSMYTFKNLQIQNEIVYIVFRGVATRHVFCLVARKTRHCIYLWVCSLYKTHFHWKVPSGVTVYIKPVNCSHTSCDTERRNWSSLETFHIICNRALDTERVSITGTVLILQT